MVEKYAFVMLGGAVGSLARYVAGIAIAGRFPGRFPLGTLFVNLTGCFVIGAVMPIVIHKPNWRLLLVTGFLGGYTTYSAFAYETYASVRGGSSWIGLLNVVASVALGYLAVWLGAICAGRR